jgi:hypothetical protein
MQCDHSTVRSFKISYNTSLFHLKLPQSQAQSYFTTNSQSICFSITLVGLAIRRYVLLECYCLKFVGLLLWGVLSDEKSGLQFAV